MTLAHRTRKGKRAVAVAAPAGDILESDPKRVAISKKEKEDDGNTESMKHDKAIVSCISQPLKLPLNNYDKEYEDEEEQGSPGDKDDEIREDDHEDNRI